MLRGASIRASVGSHTNFKEKLTICDAEIQTPQHRENVLSLQTSYAAEALKLYLGDRENDGLPTMADASAKEVPLNSVQVEALVRNMLASGKHTKTDE